MSHILFSFFKKKVTYEKLQVIGAFSNNSSSVSFNPYVLYSCTNASHSCINVDMNVSVAECYCFVFGMQCR